jgi:phenylacetate-CoA ligase
MEVTYWNREAETISRDRLEQQQLRALRTTISWALKTPFYKNRLSEVGISSPEDIEALKDLEKIPFTTKEDLRKAYPYGLLATGLSDVIRIHVSSGTTGIPTVIYHTQNDIDAWTELSARCITATGADRRDVFQNMMSYGLFTGGLGLHYGAEKVGMMVIPAGSGNTKRQFKLMRDFGTTVIHATPSYMLHLYAKHEEEEVSLGELSLKKAFVGAEPHSENTRKKLEELFGIDVYNSYGLSEMNGPGVSFECVYKDSMHVWEDHFIMEIIDPDTLDPLSEDQEGELVFTTLKRTATPLLRYRTRDLSVIHSGTCPCGRTHRRIGRIKGRTDDMLIINGVNVFPSQIEEVLMRHPDVGTNYQIIVDKKGALDRLTVKTEVTPEMFSDDMRDLNALQAKIKDLLKASISISAIVELHEPGVLPVSEGKAKRVIDVRPSL